MPGPRFSEFSIAFILCIIAQVGTRFQPQNLKDLRVIGMQEHHRVVGRFTFRDSSSDILPVMLRFRVS